MILGARSILATQSAQMAHIAHFAQLTQCAQIIIIFLLRLHNENEVSTGLLINIGATAYYTITDVAKKAGLSRVTIDRYIASGSISSPVRRQHGKKTVRTYTQVEFDKVIEQINSFPVDEAER